MERLKLATVWLIDLAQAADLVYSPFIDTKEYPEGAIANQDHLRTIKTVRERSKILVSFGDCAVTGNVTALRNPLGSAEPVLQRCYIEAADIHPQIPLEKGIVPTLLNQVQPVHRVVPVDIYLPGCPPSATRIRAVLESLLRGEKPQLEGREFIKFG